MDSSTLTKQEETVIKTVLDIARSQIHDWGLAAKDIKAFERALQKLGV